MTEPHARPRPLIARPDLEPVDPANEGPADEGTGRGRDGRFAWLHALQPVAVAVAVGGLVFVLLRALLHDGWAHSFDAAIYVRSLWGVAHGALWNPVVELHSLSIHFNVVLWLLAPFTRWAHPLDVLIAAQAASLTVTLAAAGVAAQRVAGRLAGAALVVLLALSPFVVNPFLFDVRPDLIGVPVVTLCLLRARHLGRWTRGTVFGMLAALFVREELVMAIVGALVLSPFGPLRRDDLRLRLSGALAASGVWAAYWFGVRRWLADGSYGRAQEVAAEFFEADGASWLALVGYRVELLALVALAGGGLALVGRRWLGAAVPGLLLLLLTTRMQELTAQLHYVLFVVPGLVVAATDGIVRLHGMRLPWPRSAWVKGGALALALGSFLVSSALPGGGRYREGNFFWRPLLDEAGRAQHVGVRQVHKLALRVPAQSPLAAPWGVAAPVADRDGIYTVERLDADAAWPSVTCDRLAAVLLPARAWSTVGARLTTDGGYHLAGYVDRAAALLQCEPAPLPWPHLETSEGQPRCAAPEVRWPAANLEACDLALLGDGRVAMRLQAIAPDGGPQALPTLRAGDLSAGRGPAFRFLRGLVDASQLAAGATAASFAVVTSSPAPPEWGVFVAFEHRLVDAELPSEYGWERGETFVPAERFSLR